MNSETHKRPCRRIHLNEYAEKDIEISRRETPRQKENIYIYIYILLHSLCGAWWRLQLYIQTQEFITKPSSSHEKLATCTDMSAFNYFYLQIHGVMIWFYCFGAQVFNRMNLTLKVCLTCE